MAKWTEVFFTKGRVSWDKEGNYPLEEGIRYPLGLGSIELRETPRAGLHIVRWSSRGHFNYALKLKKEGAYKLGPSYGHRVIPPDEEQDPIKRVLRKYNIPISHLERLESEEQCRALRTVTNIGSCAHEGTTEYYFLTDGEAICEEERDEGRYYIYRFQGSSYVLRMKIYQHLACWKHYLDRVVVFPNCTPEKLEAALAKIM